MYTQVENEIYCMCPKEIKYIAHKEKNSFCTYNHSWFWSHC